MPPNSKFLLAHPAHFFALGFGSGLAAKAPGTCGTLVSLPLYILIAPYSLTMRLIMIIALFLAGIQFCDVAGKNLGVTDHGSIVWDEIVAMMLVLAFTPLSAFWWFVAFCLFRLFDIWKPFPICYADAHFKNGFGVMFDDLLAAIYAILCIKFIAWPLSQI